VTDPDTDQHRGGCSRGYTVVTAAVDDLHATVRRIEDLLRQGPPTRRTLRPPVDGIYAHNKGGGWWFLTWHQVPGATGYEQDHPDTGVGPTHGPSTTIFAVASGDQRVIRVRTVSDGHNSPWVKYTLWWDGRLTYEIEGGDPPPPADPAVPVLDRVTAGHTSIAAWWTSFDVTQWETRLVDADGEQLQGHNVTQTNAVFNELRPSTTYGLAVRAVDVDTGRRSDWTDTRWKTTLAEGEVPRPDRPTGLFAHCIADTTAKVEWDQHTQVDAWEVWIGDDRDAGAIATSTPLVKLLGLQPDTEYTVHVVAVVGGEPGDADYAESEPASHTFRTRATMLPPDEDPPGDIGADLPAPQELMVRASSSTTVEAVWRDARPDTGQGNFYVATCNGRDLVRVDGSGITFTDLPPDEPVTVSVYGVMGKKLTGVATKGTTMKGAGW